MEKYSFFNDINDDRVYFAEDWAEQLKKYFTNGIFNNELQVFANNDMTLTIKEGHANIEGYRYINTSDLIKTLEPADGVLNRIDNIVIRLDLTNRNILTQVIKGVPAENPVAPDLVRTSTIYDIRLAKISLPAGTITITQDLVTDTRFITSDCGNVISAVETPDTEQLYTQLTAKANKVIEEMSEKYNKWNTDTTQNFDEWFNLIKGQINGDMATKLQNEINTINKKLSEVYTKKEVDSKISSAIGTALGGSY